MRKIPKHIVEVYGSARAFKAKKRQDLRTVERAVDELRLGCAFLPGGPLGVKEIAAQVEVMRHECSVAEWGR